MTSSEILPYESNNLLTICLRCKWGGDEDSGKEFMISSTAHVNHSNYLNEWLYRAKWGVV